MKVRRSRTHLRFSGSGPSSSGVCPGPSGAQSPETRLGKLCRAAGIIPTTLSLEYRPIRRPTGFVLSGFGLYLRILLGGQSSAKPLLLR